MKKHLINTFFYDDKGKRQQTFIDRDKTESYDFKGRWTKQIEEHKKRRIKDLYDIIEKINLVLETGELKKNKLDIVDKYILTLFLEELKMDFREDKALIKYKGKIPKKMDKKMLQKNHKRYTNLRDSWGKDVFFKIKDIVDTEFWGNVTIEYDESTGSGRIL